MNKLLLVFFFIVYILTFFAVNTSYSDSGFLSGRVIRVIDGDSLVANINGSETRIRLAYIDTPEHNQPWGIQSKAALMILLKGANPQFRVVDRDRYGRFVSEVWVGNRSINEAMVRLGQAWAYERYVPPALKLRYRSLMKSARGSRAGLWNAPAPVPPWDWRKAGG